MARDAEVILRPAHQHHRRRRHVPPGGGLRRRGPGALGLGSSHSWFLRKVGLQTLSLPRRGSVHQAAAEGPFAGPAAAGRTRASVEHPQKQHGPVVHSATRRAGRGGVGSEPDAREGERGQQRHRAPRRTRPPATATRHPEARRRSGRRRPHRRRRYRPRRSARPQAPGRRGQAERRPCPAGSPVPPARRRPDSRAVRRWRTAAGAARSRGRRTAGRTTARRRRRRPSGARRRAASPSWACPPR